MIEVNHICKDFISPKKYPGLKGAIKGLFSTEKVVKSAVSTESIRVKKEKRMPRITVLYSDSV